MVFDNSEGRAAGQWSTYAEIAVRRVLTRDGTSSYFVNNQQVRRRDIHDIFLAPAWALAATPSSARA